MKRYKSVVGVTVLLVLAAVVLLVPGAAGAATFSTFVGCDDLAENPVPAHVCRLDDFPAAYFESDTDTEYDVCVEFPDGQVLCQIEEEAEGEVLYLNSIVTDEAGEYFVIWFVEEVEVGSWSFRIDAPPPPPAPAPPIVVVPPAPVVAPTRSGECLKDIERISKLQARLRKADTHKQKVKIRGKLKNARAAVKLAC
jgi:hypothetical protein